jgi:hypothetical protein
MYRRLAPLFLLIAGSAFAQTADVSVSIAAPTTVDSAATIFWSFEIVNNGPGVANGVVPSFMTSPNLQTFCDPTKLDPLPRNAKVTVGCFTAALGSAGTVTFQATAGYATDPVAGNNVATATVQSIVGPRLGILITSPYAVDPGLPFDLGVRWSNFSAIDATNAIVVVTLPPATTVTGLPDFCSEAAARVTCSVGTIPRHKSTLGPSDLTLTVTPSDATNGQIIGFTGDITAREPQGDQTNIHYTLATRVFRTFYVTQNDGFSLSIAIDDANSECGGDYPCKIGFRLTGVPESGYFTLKPVVPLPAITSHSLSIDGTTQTRIGGDTNPDGPEIFIDGSNLVRSANGNGFVFDEPCAAEVRSMAIGNFSNAAITMSSKFESPGQAPCGDVYIRSVHDNYIGVDPTGRLAAPNGRGVVIDEALFGATSVVGNVISGNLRSGIFLARAFNNSVSANTIGLDVDLQPLGNGASGIYVGPGCYHVDIRGNYVAFNHDFGVAVDRNAKGTDIEPNSIFANWQLGIDVGLDGPTPKSGVPAPDILSAHYDPATDTTVIVAASSVDPAVVKPAITFYASDAPHPSGFGDGQYFLGDVPHFDPTKGNITFAAKGDWRGKWIAATVTSNVFLGFLSSTPRTELPDTLSTTSEFSRAVKAE